MKWMPTSRQGLIVPDKSLGNKDSSVSPRSLVVQLVQSCWDVGTSTKGAIFHANRRYYDGLLRTIMILR